MRRFYFCLALAALATPLAAQDKARVIEDTAQSGRISALMDSVRADPYGAVLLSKVSRVVAGGMDIAAGTTVEGPIAVSAGAVHVRGVVRGDVTAIGGDVIVHPGGRVDGNATSFFGSVRLEGGDVTGEVRAFSGAVGGRKVIAERAVAPPTTTWGELKLALGWLAVCLLVGLGILTFLAPYLDGVVETLEDHFWRSLGAGILGGLGLLPGLLLAIILLAVTVIGALLIPFAIVAFMLGTAGALALGFFAVARMTGSALGGARGRLSARAHALRSLIVGITLLLSAWIVAAAAHPWPLPHSLLRGLALALSLVALTAGFGAVLLSRAGTRRQPAPAKDVSVADWQTPTPVAGVAAARRPARVSGGSP